MRRLALSALVVLPTLTGCGRHHQDVRPAAPAVEAAANDPKPPPPRINNAESETVKNWSTGDR